MNTRILITLPDKESYEEIYPQLIKKVTSLGGSCIFSVYNSEEPSFFNDSDITPVDIGIVIALEEEFREIFPQIQSKSIFIKEINQYFYTFERGLDNKNKYRCVVTFIGGMGIGKAAIVADRLISIFKPSTIINIGIAGSLDKDVLIGDVVVAQQADDYLVAAKVVNNENAINFQVSGDPYKSTLAYVKHAENLRYAYFNSANDWLKSCKSMLSELVEKDYLTSLLEKNLVRESPELLTGNIASGDVVVTAELFVEWLKKRDRKYLAVEMEAAGIMCAAYSRSIDTVIIRGISDFSDSRKKEFDDMGKGALRRYAMNNALGLLWTMIELKLIKRNLFI